MDEIWKTIPGCVGYEASSLGRIRSYYKRKGRGWELSGTPQRILKPGKIDKYGRLAVNIKCSITSSTTVHRLVMLTFVGSCPDGLEICHNDGDPANNRLDNLRYDTRKANHFDAIKHNGGVYPSSTLTPEIVTGIRQAIANHKIAREISKEFGVSVGIVETIQRGIVYKHIPGEVTVRQAKMERARKVKRMREEGYKIREIAATLNIHKVTVHKILRGEPSYAHVS